MREIISKIVSQFRGRGCVYVLWQWPAFFLGVYLIYTYRRPGNPVALEGEYLFFDLDFDCGRSLWFQFPWFGRY